MFKGTLDHDSPLHSRDLSTLPLSLIKGSSFLPSLTSSRLNDSGVNKVGVPPTPPPSEAKGDGRTRRSHAMSSLLRAPLSVFRFPSPMGEGEGGESTEQRAARLHFFTTSASSYPQRVRSSPGWRDTLWMTKRAKVDTTRSHFGSSIWKCKPSWPLLPSFLPSGAFRWIKFSSCGGERGGKVPNAGKPQPPDAHTAVATGPPENPTTATKILLQLLFAKFRADVLLCRRCRRPSSSSIAATVEVSSSSSSSSSSPFSAMMSFSASPPLSLLRQSCSSAAQKSD